MAWTAVLTDRAGKPYGELRQATGRGWRRSLNRGRSGRFTIGASNALVARVMAADKTLVKLYDDRTGSKVLRHCGPITGYQKGNDENGKGTLVANTNDPSWRLLSRLIGKNVAGASFGTPLGLVDRGTVMTQIVQALNAGDAGPIYTSADDTGIRPAVAVLAAPTGLTVTPYADPNSGGVYYGNTQVSYAVTAIDASGQESAPSATVAATASNDIYFDHGFILNWNPVPGAHHYRIYRRTLSTPPGLGGNSTAPGSREWSHLHDSTYFDAHPTQSDDTGGYYYDPGDIPGARPGPGLGYFGPWRYYPAASAFAELATGIDAPDWDIVPIEPAADQYGTQLGALVIAPALGTLRPNVGFEYGAGARNVKSYSLVVDAGQLCNDAYSLPTGFPDNATASVLEQQDATSIGDRGLHEDVVAGDVITDTLRQQLLVDHVAVRKVPRMVIEFSPIRDPDPIATPLAERRVPRPFIDYDVGDVVRFRATELVDVRDTAGTIVGCTETKTIDAFFRVYTIDIEIGDDGSEIPTLTFVEEG